MITLTVDLEDPTEQYEADGGYVAMTRRILEMCEQQNRCATFFTIGRIATSAPHLVQEIAAKGHEVAYHSHNHVSLTEEEPQRFRRESREDKDRFEQLTGKAVTGFRAPRFSLTPQSVWAIDALGELGFRYSSSIMPTSISRFGFPNASRKPFKWPNGMVEFPLPVADCGPLRIPYLGGIYLYALPAFLSQYWLRQADTEEVLWTYTHPYDFDREEKFKPMPHTPFWVSAVLWLARRSAEKKLVRILQTQPAGKPLCELTENLR